MYCLFHNNTTMALAYSVSSREGNLRVHAIYIGPLLTQTPDAINMTLLGHNGLMFKGLLYPVSWPIYHIKYITSVK